jgi:hypothetical protein
MRQIKTIREAQKLKVGTPLLLMNFKQEGLVKSLNKYQFLFTEVFSPLLARAQWGGQWNKDDVWYKFPDEQGCYIFTDCDRNELLWDVFVLRKGEVDKVRLLYDV